MTMVDVMALSAGVALSIQFRPKIGAFPYAMPDPRAMLVISVAWLFWLGASSTSVVVAARLARYRRFPRPAEWLAILISLIGVQTMGPLLPIDMLIQSLPFGMMGASDTFQSWRWTMAALAIPIVAMGLALFRLFRDVLPPWARTALLVVLAYLTLAGPISAIWTDGVDLLAPSAGFGLGRLSMLYRLGCQLVATTPLALMIGIPAVAALIERVRRARWRWTEWACTSASILTGLALTPLYKGHLPFPSVGGTAERFLILVWLLGVGILSRVILSCFGPTWSRWLGDQTEGPGSTPIDSSPASTFST